MVERRRLPSASYHSPFENECWSRCLFAEQLVMIIDDNRDAAQIARHVANKQPAPAPFFVMDMPSVMARVDDWQRHLSRVQAYYALGCNADPVLARILADVARLGFAVSDTQQLVTVSGKTIHDQIVKALELVPANRIIMDCPLWTRKAMRVAGECDVGTIVIENEKELMDAISYAPHARILLAMSLAGSRNNSDSLCTRKGASIEELEEILITAFELRANIVGIRLILNFRLTGILVIRNSYFAASAFVLCTNVIGKKALEARYITKDDFDDGVGFVYQTNDSVYGSFGCLLMNSQLECIPLDEISDAPQHFGTILGASLQPGDVAQSLIRCRQLCVGDWLLWRDAGAYTMPLNGEYAVPPVYYFAGTDKW
uniref:Orn_Arg_deC_N domain-containing protein n=1 Tax=Angiostrongylus cantonensis TaxID=6313 RepID=A0A0K0DE65_ANGCA